MLSVSEYSRSYIEDCQRKIHAQIAAFRRLKAGTEREALEPRYFNHLLLTLDGYFNHRARAVELTDGNALNEVRMLCAGIAEGDGTLQADPNIEYDASKSVLKLALGARVALDQAAFEALSAAFFAELRRKFA